MTEKLYYQRDYVKEFDAVILESRPKNTQTWEIILDRTAFYPEGGGQPYDSGYLNDVEVMEVHERDGLVLHTTNTYLEPGIKVHGILNWNRRFRIMQQHSGEHLLSGLIHTYLGYDNVGFHMGKEEVTIDFNGVITPEQLWDIEQIANQMIYETIPIEISYPDEETLMQLDYRSKKELKGSVRMVTIPGGDRCACCGTHLHQTGEIGIIKTTGMIHYKGGVRISMQCGLDALEDYEQRIKQHIAISRLLSAKQTDLVSAVERMKLDSERKAEKISRLYRQLIELKVSGYNESKEPLLIFEPDMESVSLRHMCTALYEAGKGSVVMVCSGIDGAYYYAAGSSCKDMCVFQQELSKSMEGRGGGSSFMVQGTLQAAESQIDEVFHRIVKKSENKVEI